MFGLDDAAELAIGEALGKMLLERVAPLVIKELKNAGAIDYAEKVSAMGVVEFVDFIGGLKTYYAPTDFPNPPNENPATTNLTQTDGDKVGA